MGIMRTRHGFVRVVGMGGRQRGQHPARQAGHDPLPGRRSF